MVSVTTATVLVRGLLMGAGFVLATGCGPAGIAVGIGALGDDGSAGGPLAPAATGSLLTTQIADGRTQFQLRLEQTDGRDVRFWLEYSVDGGAFARVGANSFGVLQGGVFTPVPFDDVARGHWILGTAPGGVAYPRVWDHENDLGRAEVQDVTLRLRLADAEAADNVDAFLSVDLFRGPVGRANGTVSIDSVTRPGGPESPFVVRARYEDPAGDLDLSQFDLRYRGSDASGGTTGWVPVVDWSRQETLDNRPTGPIAYDLEFSVDPLAQGLNNLPRRRFEDVEFQVRLREDHVAGGARFGSKTMPWTGWVGGGSGPVSVGEPPVFERLDLPQPPRVARFRVPVTFTVRNDSALPVTLDFTGQYRFEASDGPMTLIDPKPLTVASGDTAPHSLVWDLSADLGLGLHRTLQKTVQVTLQAAVSDVGPGAPIVGSGRSDDPRISFGAAIVSTEPFVEFDTTLAEESTCCLAVLPRESASAPQRLFEWGSPDPSQPFATELRLDQQFETMPIAGAANRNFGNGVFQVAPSNLVPTPNCVVYFAGLGNVSYVQWDLDGSVSTSPIGDPTAGPTERINIPGQSVQFTMPPVWFDAGGTDAVAHLSFTTGFPGSEVIEVTPQVIVPGGDPLVRTNWTVTTTPRQQGEQRPIESAYYELRSGEVNWKYWIHGIEGDFGGPAATGATMVVADVSCNYGPGPGGAAGFLDVLAVQVDPTTRKASFNWTPIPRDGLEPLTPQDHVFRMDMRELQHPDDPPGAKPGIVLAREFFRDGRQLQLWYIPQDPVAGGFAGQSWRALPSPLPAPNAAIDDWAIGRLYTRDIDADGQVDLMLGVNGRSRLVGELADVNGGTFSGVAKFKVDGSEIRYTIPTNVTLPGATAEIENPTRGYTISLRNPSLPTLWQDVEDVAGRIADGMAGEWVVNVRDGSGALVLTGPIRAGRTLGESNLFVMSNAPGHQVWRRVFEPNLDASRIASGGQAYDNLSVDQLVDVNGDGNHDLVLHVSRSSSNYEQKLVYMSSAFTGVVESLTTQFNAAIQPTRRPALIDLNRDGISDMISGAIYLGDAGGTFRLGNSGFLPASDSQFWVEQILDVQEARADELDVLGFSQAESRIDNVRLGPSPATDRRVSIDGNLGTILAAIPVMPTAGAEHKDLAVVVEQGQRQVLLLRLDATETQFELHRTVPTSSGPIGDVAVARAGPVPAGSDRLRNRIPQDVFYATAGPAGRVYWLRYEQGYLNPIELSGVGGRAGEAITALESGLFDGDDREDLVVLTRQASQGGQPSQIRVYLVSQSDTGIRFTNRAPRIVMRYEAGGTTTSTIPLPSEPSGWSLNAFDDDLAQGVILAADEVRVLRPTRAPGGVITFGMVRSPIAEDQRLKNASAVGILATDFDVDDLLDVVGGIAGQTVFRLDRDDRTK